MFIKIPSLGKVVSTAILATALSACSSSDDDGDILAGGDDSVIGDVDAEIETITDPVTDAEPVALLATCDAADAAVTPSVEDAPVFAFASTAAADFSAGRLERIAVAAQPELSGCTPAGPSDVRVATDGTDAYAIGRFQIDSLTRFESETLATIFQFSVFADDALSANPHDVVFLNETKAYVARYGTTNVWIVNPSATTETEFFLGTLDLSAYDDDGATEMTRVEIVGDSLFILMQRLQNFSATQNSAIAVFDVNTDTEIVTGTGADGLNGIVLPVNNVNNMFFNAETNDLIVSAEGDLFNTSIPAAERLSGGLVAVDASDFSVEVLIDDNELNASDTLAEDFQPVFLNAAVIVSSDTGYISSSPLGFGDSFSIRRFNPTTGVIEEAPLAEFDGVNVTTMALGPNSNVWVGVGDFDAPGFDRIDPADDSLVGQRIRTELVPSQIVFIDR